LFGRLGREGRLLLLLCSGLRLGWSGRPMSLLHLKVVDDSLHTVNSGGIVGRSGTFAVTRDIAAERDHATRRQHYDLAALDPGIEVNLVLHVTCNPRIAGDSFF